MNEEVLKTLLNDIYTSVDLHDTVVSIREFLESQIFVASPDANANFKESLNRYIKEKNISPDIEKHLHNLPESFFKQFTKDNLYDITEQVLKQAETLPHIVLYVAVELPHEEVKKIGTWLRENVAGNALMHIKHDPSTAGGCAFVWNGEYHDFSLQYFIQKNRGEIISMINSHKHGSESK